MRVGRGPGGESAVWASTAVAALLGCTTPPPKQPDDLCSIFKERPGWYRDSRAAQRRWGVPIPLQLAVVYQESSFRARARPPRRRFLGFIPWRRPSSAYGYGQATRDAWDAYRRGTGRGSADRDDYGDVVDFIGWFGAQGADRYGIPRDQPVPFYLSYHEGHAGYLRRTHREKAWLAGVARKVDARASRFKGQLLGCQEALEKLLRRWWWPF